MEAKSRTSTPRLRSKAYDQYEFKEQIGKGQFGRVFRAIKIEENKEFAIKVIALNKIKLHPKLKKLINNQMEVLKMLRHPNIIQFHELFCDSENVYMVYELCEEKNFQDSLPLPVNDLVPIFKQIIDACAFAERKRALHRDLKPANILFQNGIVKIADWGFSCELKANELTKSFIGSPAYMAPELLSGEKYSNKADVWSLGIMLYECIHGSMPWEVSSVKDLQLSQRRDPFKLKIGIPKILKAIILKSLVLDPNKRSSFSQLNSLISKQITEPSMAIMNPETDQEQQGFSEEDIKKCSYFLEFAKSLTFENSHKVNPLCLQLILLNLQKLKRQKFPKKRNESFTFDLLAKEIKLIEKLLQNQSQKQEKQTSKFSQTKIRQLICILLEKELKKVLLSFEVSRSDSRPQKKKLIWMCSVLDILFYEELPLEEKRQKLSFHKEKLSQLSLVKLLKKVENRLEMGIMRLQ